MPSPAYGWERPKAEGKEKKLKLKQLCRHGGAAVASL